LVLYLLTNTTCGSPRPLFTAGNVDLQDLLAYGLSESTTIISNTRRQIVAYHLCPGAAAAFHSLDDSYIHPPIFDPHDARHIPAPRTAPAA